MESVIYYFSATGNSLRIANIMAERMDGLLLPMSKYKGTNAAAGKSAWFFLHISGAFPEPWQSLWMK